MNCRHHWICESPGLGHEVPARCKLCGMERTFYPERGLDKRSSQAKMANRKGQPKRHPKKVVAA